MNDQNKLIKKKADKNIIEEYWQRYLAENKNETATKYSYYFFCDNEKDANELASLVVAGKKRATASNAYVYKHEGEPIPKIGDICIITDFYNYPRCIIKTIKVDIIPFNKVPAEFAALEGEGDGSLEYWRQGHKLFFTRECKEIGKPFTEDMPVVCEQFQVVYI